MFWTFFFIAIAVLFIFAGFSVRAKGKQLRLAPRGTTRVEAVKASAVNRTVAEYTRAGWKVVAQTTAKSFGSQARVTITFKKG